MCGIVGYTGLNEAAPILLEGLSKLEYRGYDSAGLAVRDADKETVIIKAKGKLKELYENNYILTFLSYIYVAKLINIFLDIAINSRF